MSSYLIPLWIGLDWSVTHRREGACACGLVVDERRESDSVEESEVGCGVGRWGRSERGGGVGVPPDPRISFRRLDSFPIKTLDLFGLIEVR